MYKTLKIKKIFNELKSSLNKTITRNNIIYITSYQKDKVGYTNKKNVIKL